MGDSIIAWQPKGKPFQVMFKSNESVYEYFDVPESVQDGLRTAINKGAYLGAKIKGVYRYVKVTEDQPTEWLIENGSVFKDDNAWCAVRPSFTNLQESSCGFGDTMKQAIEELVKNEAANDVQT